jgi:hypothetical protein
MRELRSPRRLKGGQQVELAAILGAVAAAAGRHHTEGVATPAERAWDQVRRVDSAIVTADDARPPSDRGALSVGGRHRSRSLELLRPS